MEEASGQIATAGVCLSLLLEWEKTATASEQSKLQMPSQLEHSTSQMGSAIKPQTNGDLFRDSLFEEAGMPNLIDFEWDSWDAWVGPPFDMD